MSVPQESQEQKQIWTSVEKTKAYFEIHGISAFQLGILIIAAGNSVWPPLFLLSPVAVMNHHILFTSHKCFIFKEL